MSEKNVLELKNISFTYPGAESPILKDVNLSVKKGEVVAIYGLNGCGKSTLLKIIHGSIPFPYEGEVLLNGERIENGSVEHYKKMSFFRQSNEGASAYTVMSELTDEGRISMEKAMKIAEYFKCGSLLNARMSSLSGGQRQIVYLMEAFLRDEGELIILDEPINNLDSDKARLLSNYIKDFVAIHPEKAVIIVTHCRMFPGVTAYELSGGVLSKMQEGAFCQTCFGAVDENGYYDVSACRSEEIKKVKMSFLEKLRSWFSE